MEILANRVAVITGGTRGLGYYIAQACIREGAAVVVGSRSPASVDEAVQTLKDGGGQVSGLPCDVGDRSQVEDLANHAIERYGGLHIWVNNAGLACPYGPTVHIPHEWISALIRTNILGTYHGTLVAMRHFVPQGSGKLINILGRGSKRPIPMQNAYASSKAWIQNFTLALAKEYKQSGVGIYLFNPGIVQSDMTQKVHFVAGFEDRIKIFNIVARLWSNPPDVPAQKAVWLASSKTDGRTGLVVDLLNPWAMLNGVGRSALQRILRRDVFFQEPDIVTIEPAMVIHEEL